VQKRSQRQATVSVSFPIASDKYSKCMHETSDATRLERELTIVLKRCLRTCDEDPPYRLKLMLQSQLNHFYLLYMYVCA
jgi:hypothetical protein